MRKLHTLLALSLLGASSAALGQTTLPLNTGFNHSNFTVYPAPNPGPVVDNYWIKVAASNAPLNVPAFVINKHPAWQAPLTGGGFGSQWIGAASPDGQSPPGQTYAIYRKCVCLLPGFRDAKVSFQIRGDDAIQVWLNSVTNTIVAGQGGSFAGAPIQGPGPGLTPQFRVGVNCFYAVVEDLGGVVTGFNLAGTVTAHGLMPMAAAGSGMSFEPCQCKGGPRSAVAEDRATIQAIVRLVEQRRRTGATPTPR